MVFPLKNELLLAGQSITIEIVRLFVVSFFECVKPEFQGVEHGIIQIHGLHPEKLILSRREAVHPEMPMRTFLGFRKP
jgi:hypothetical protein